MKVISTATNIGQAFKNAGRVREIVTIFVAHGFVDLIHRMKLTRFLPGKLADSSRYADIPTPMRLRSAFEQLGPTFVKLGQILATRPDLIPEPFVEEFQKLNDNVASVPSREIKQFIEVELKRPIDDVFAEFDDTPLAAASIGQVHAARLKSGEKVAVKVQRPGIERIIQNDISILRGIAVLLQTYVPESRPMNPVGLVEEFFKTILFELDFRVEANNMKRIRANLASVPKVTAPIVYTQFSSHRVLVQERFEGHRLTDPDAIRAAGINPAEVIEAGADAFFHMVMHDGLFHGDLHAGNLFVLPDGRIGMIDFGMVGRLSRKVQDSVITMFLAIIDEDYETLAIEYLSLCHSTGRTNIGALQKELMDTISPYVGMALGEVNVGQLLLRSTSTAVRHNLIVPRELMLLFKAILTIESLGKRLDPTFDILQVGHRLARQVITTRYSRERISRDLLVAARDLQTLAESLPKLAKRFFKTWSQNDFAFEVRNPDIADLSTSVREFARAMALATLTVGCFALGIALLILDRGPWFLSLPVPATFSLSLGTALALFSFLRLRPKKE